MNGVFTHTAEHSIAGTVCPASLNELPGAIYTHTGWDYSFVQTDTGCILKPAFRNMPYRNSFVPEIDIVVSQEGARSSLHMRGQPVKLIRIFMGFWFGFLLLIQVFLLAFAGTLDSAPAFQFFIPVILCVFAYLLCKIASGLAFRSVMEVIQKELR